MVTVCKVRGWDTRQTFDRTIICFTDQKTREQNLLPGPTPLRVSSYTSYILCIVHGPFSACTNSQIKELRKKLDLVDQLPFGSVPTPAISCTKFKTHSAHADSPMTKTFNLFHHFFVRTSLCFTDQENSGREYAWWTNSLVGQFLHQLSLVQRSRPIQRMQTVP